MDESTGYEIHDDEGLTIGDFADAVTDHGDDIEDYCNSEWDRWSCTRHAGHDGPHIAAVADNAITSIWDNNE